MAANGLQFADAGRKNGFKIQNVIVAARESSAVVDIRLLLEGAHRLAFFEIVFSLGGRDAGPVDECATGSFL